MQSLTKLLLFGESFSPWTKKARWALEYCDLAYDYQEYVPTLSEVGLRIRLRQFRGSVSVPIMLTDSHVYRGSWEIASYANHVCGDERLGDMGVILNWDRLSEDALAERRSQIVRDIHANETALEEALPSFIPKTLRRPMRFVARDAVQRLDRKYAHLLKHGSLQVALSATREALREQNNDHLLGKFSYADITMAVVLEAISPIAVHHPPLGPETRKVWRDDDLAAQYSDLVEWRNRLAFGAKTSYSQFRSLSVE